MQKFSYIKKVFISCCIFVLGYCCVISPTNPYIGFHASQATANKSFLQDWLNSAHSQSTLTIDKATPSTPTEIWSRVRSHFDLHTPSTKPLFKRHVTRYAKSQSYINELIKNASPYFFYVLEEVEKRGMPSEIALLPMIESEFNPHTISNKGAVGLWQLMPTLGRIYGLKQNSWYDGRKDIYESTKVALDHLEYLHKKFGGNWLLALAAYNSGETRVLNAIKLNKTAKKPTDFWSLSLPKETTHYVPKLLALVEIIKSPKQYGVVLPSIANQPVFERINTGKAIDIAHAAKLADVTETQLRKLNPGLPKKTMNPNGPFHLVVPIGLQQKVGGTSSKMSLAMMTAETKTTVEKKSVTKETPTKTLSPKKTDANKIVKKSAHQDIKIVSKKSVAPKTAAKTKIHIVKAGDTIPKISKKYGVKINALLANNHLTANTLIHPGQKIILAKS